jgi:hypothetical protein
MLKKTVFLFATGALSAPAGAQDANYRQFIERTTAAAPAPAIASLQAQALEMLQGNARAEGRCVPTAVALERLESATAVRVITESVAAGQVKNGWTMYGRASGCPQPYLAHLMVLRMADDALRVLVVNEGETLANPSLMRDMAHLAAAAATSVARTADPGCDGADLRMGPTRIVDRARLGTYFYGAYFSGSWSEAWTFLVCRKRIEIPITFTADANGGADYHVRGSEARILD